MESSSSAICDTLEVILINTYNSNQILREQAEAALKQFIQTPGSCYHILLLVSNHTKHRDLRQAAEILLKNRLRGYWSSTDDLSTSIDEKIAFKSTLLQTLVSETDNSIKTLLAENIRTIGEFEFLDDGTTSWPEFIPTILSYIQSSDPSIMYNALLGLRKLIKRYEFRASDKRTILDTILTATFPTIQALIVGLLSNNQLEGAHILRLCFKIFWSVTVYKLPQNPVVDYPLWFNALATLLQKPLPEANEGIEPLGQPVRDEERRAWPWWKVTSLEI